MLYKTTGTFPVQIFSYKAKCYEYHGDAEDLIKLYTYAVQNSPLALKMCEFGYSYIYVNELWDEDFRAIAQELGVQISDN